MSDEIVIATTTDPIESAQAVVDGDSDGARVTVDQSSLRDFRQNSDGSSVSFESPQSERATLIERLQQDAQDLVEFEVVPDEQAQPENETEAGDVDLAEVRRVATADAIAEGRRRAAQQQALSPEQAGAMYSQVQTANAQAFESKVQDVGRREPERLGKITQNIQAAVAEGVRLSPDAIDALLVHQATDAYFRLGEDPAELRRVAALPPAAQAVRIWQLQNEADQQRARRRPVSRAPAPISPVGGSATKSSVPRDELPYQDYVRVREAEIRARRGR